MMKHREWAIYPVILAIVIAGLLAFGVPASTLVYPALTLACPLMMIFTRGGRGRHHGGHRQPTTAGRRYPRPTRIHWTSV